MASLQDDPDALRDIIATAMSMADERLHYLVAALLAQCLEELGGPKS